MEFKVNDFVIRKAEHVLDSWEVYFPRYDFKPLKIIDVRSSGISIRTSRGITTWDPDKFTKYKKFSYLAERMKSV
jgi:hypothetical protein